MTTHEAIFTLCEIGKQTKVNFIVSIYKIGKKFKMLLLAMSGQLDYGYICIFSICSIVSIYYLCKKKENVKSKILNQQIQ